ncbi:Aste57867_8852 [Aphanomyces stellatus]|uniref:Aste57867_8852 protein n=1 Tax=Aphanomyces stellatus TaxID=120398 RepID=A0A485KLQ6_9STRA|nr:hypothetical protein As57867_008817 [Aphanomyces stellatus]VFT85738.1 Aste57867_8852 [Aphanomyces stellatus]
MPVKRIALIHGLRHSPPPIEAAFKRIFPQARLHNILDDALASDLVAAQARHPTETVHASIRDRFLALGRYAASTGAHGILFTCSAFGPYIEAVQADLVPLPVLKPNEAMVHDLLALETTPVALVATFAPTLASMHEEIAAIVAARGGNAVDILPVHVPGALDALNAGDVARHDALIVAEVKRTLAVRCDIGAVALTQFSIGHVQDSLVKQLDGIPVLSTPASAVRAMQQRLLGGATAAQ